MPFENKESLRAWKTVFVGYVEHPRGGWAVMFRFEVTSPANEGKSIRPIFTMEFVDDYFHIAGDRGMDIRRSTLIREKEELFKRWARAKIEECISRGSLEEEPEITRKDFRWAEKVEKGSL